MSQKPWAPLHELPWKDPRLILAALDLAMDIRDLDVAEVLDALRLLPVETAAHLLVATAAMVDVDRTESELLGWTGGGRRCPSGEHLMTSDNASVQRNGGNALALRCRACDRARQAARRSPSLRAVS